MKNSRKLIATFFAIISSFGLLSGQEKIRSYKNSFDYSEIACFSADDRFAIMANKSKLRLRFVGSKTKYANFKTHLFYINDLAVYAKENQVFVAGKPKSLLKKHEIEVWDIDTKTKTDVFYYHTEEVVDLAISRNGKRMVSCSKHEAVVWDVLSKDTLSVYHSDKAIMSVAISPKGDRIAVGGVEKKIRILDALSLAQLDSITQKGYIKAMEYNPKGTHLCSGGTDGYLYITEFKDSTITEKLKTGGKWIESLSYSKDGKYLAIGGKNKLTSFYITKEKVMHSSVKQRKMGGVSSVDFSHNGDYFISAGTLKGKHYLYDVKNLDISPVFDLKDKTDIVAPQIYVSQPANINENRVTFSKEVVTISGLAIDEGGLKTISINGIPTPLSDGGNFLINFPLTPGENFITIEATDVNDNVALKKFIIDRKDQADVAYIPEEAEQHLLVIGVDAYEHWPVLNNAVNDANSVKDILSEKYGFKDENITFITNEKATRSNIYSTLRSLISNIGSQDNLIIYYTGHGYFDELLNEGYWIPVDANLNNTGTYFSNSDLVKILKNIDSHHTFLVADACFSGALFQSSTRGYAENVETQKSRWALTSGRLEEVSDGTGKNSPFTSSFVDFLNQNDKDKLTASELIQHVKIEVSEISNQTPIGSPLKGIGDEGGEFVFYKKEQQRITPDSIQADTLLSNTRLDTVPISDTLSVIDSDLISDTIPIPNNATVTNPASIVDTVLTRDTVSLLKPDQPSEISNKTKKDTLKQNNPHLNLSAASTLKKVSTKDSVVLAYFETHPIEMVGSYKHTYYNTQNGRAWECRFELVLNEDGTCVTKWFDGSKSGNQLQEVKGTWGVKADSTLKTMEITESPEGKWYEIVLISNTKEELAYYNSPAYYDKILVDNEQKAYLKLIYSSGEMIEKESK